MRKDMAERFSEGKARYDKGKFPRSNKKVNKKDEDGQQQPFLGMRKIHAQTTGFWDSREYGSDYPLLTRFLTSKVGEKWDDVYSEICSAVDKRTRDGYRFRESIERLVETNTSIMDGKLCDDRGYEIGTFYFWHRFYVHPETGVLHKSKKTRWRRPEIIQNVFELDGQMYHKHDNIWYRVEMKNVPDGPRTRYGMCSYEHSFTDAFQATEPPLAQTYYWDFHAALTKKYGLSPQGKLWYCASKQSAGKRDIDKVKKKHNLE